MPFILDTTALIDNFAALLSLFSLSMLEFPTLYVINSILLSV